MSLNTTILHFDNRRAEQAVARSDDGHGLPRLQGGGLASSFIGHVTIDGHVVSGVEVDTNRSKYLFNGFQFARDFKRFIAKVIVGGQFIFFVSRAKFFGSDSDRWWCRSGVSGLSFNAAV